MFRNYFVIAIRNLQKNKIFSLINIMGLALGLTCSLLIFLWVQSEYQQDAFHKNGQRLFSIYEKQFRDGQVNAFHGTPGVLADEMKRVMPEVQYATNMAWTHLSTFEANNKIIKETGNYAGQDFFSMFSFPLLEGNAATALLQPTDIAISKKMADDFFGSPAQAIGKTIRFQNKTDFKITAVFANVPANSTLRFDFLITWKKFLEENSWAKNWTNNGPPAYIVLREGTDAKAFEKKITRFLDAYDKDQTPRDYIRLGIERFGDVYLYSHFNEKGDIDGGRIQYVKLFSMVAIFILLIACINFMNLTTARSVKRAKEIGVRKVVGAVRAALIAQFIGETIVIVAIAIIIALLLVMGALPYFNELTRKDIHMPFTNTWFWPGMLGLLLITGLLAGSYPALFLSSFKPVRVLKGALKFSGSAIWLRKGLVIFQFMLSILLIIGTIVINKQVNYIQTVNLGYDRENLLYIPLEGDLLTHYSLFKEQVLPMPGIKTVSRITDMPTDLDNSSGGIEWEGKDPHAPYEFNYTAVGYDFSKTMHLQFVQGRDYSKDFATDSTGYLINESALKIIGYKDPIGKPLTFWGKKGTIIGVMKDFHFKSLHSPILPLVIRQGEQLEWGMALVRTEAGKTKQALASLEKICKNLNPKFPFSYKFADDEYQDLYKSEQVVSRLSGYFAFLGIFISCMGLLGLVIFTAEQRTKEIGVRKVLGASVSGIVHLLSIDFLKLVALAFVIAGPLAWFSMHQWLQNFAYRTNMSWWVFAAAGMATVVIAFAAISFQAIKAAMTNPVKALRSE
jgi:predicted permease